MKTPTLFELLKQPASYERLLLLATNLKPESRPEKIEQILFDLAWANHGIIYDGRIMRTIKKSTKTPMGELRADLAEKKYLASKLRYEFKDELKRVRK